MTYVRDVIQPIHCTKKSTDGGTSQCFNDMASIVFYISTCLSLKTTDYQSHYRNLLMTVLFCFREMHIKHYSSINRMTLSLLNKEVDGLAKVWPENVLVYPSRKKGRYGHAILVADVAKSRSGKTVILCVEGNTPAREAHVLRNPNPFRRAWHTLGDSGDIQVSFFRFHQNELRHYWQCPPPPLKTFGSFI